MNTNNSFRQFAKDGLVGVVVALTVFVIMAVLDFITGSGWGFVELMSPFTVTIFSESGFFFGGTPIVILTAFISIGIGGRFLETIMASRKEWMVAILKTSGISLLAGVGLSLIQGIFHAVQNPGAEELLFIVFLPVLFIIGGGFGALIGFVIGSIAGIIFKPQKRLYKIVIGAISSALIGIGGGFVISALFAGALCC